MVASSVVMPVVPPVTRLPGETRRSPIRPVIGARSSVNCRSSSACLTAASCAVDLRLRGAVRLGALIEQLLGDGALAHQRLRALQVGLGEGEIGLRLRQIGAHLIERVLERPAVDGEQQIALLDDLAVLEMDLVEIAGHARADLDRVHRDEAPDILVLIDDGALDRLRHRHGGRRRRGLLLWGFAASRQRERQE